MTNVIPLGVKKLEEPTQPQKPKEFLRELKVFHADCVCPKCDQGHMIPIPFEDAMKTWPSLGQGQPMFPHNCNSCGHTESYPERYPTLRYVLADTM